MQVSTRRALLAAAATFAAGTVAAATMMRKPAQPPVYTIRASAGPHLRGPEGLTPVSPPHRPNPASFLAPDGHPATLADFAGKGLVVNLWATWCAPCVAEMPALQRLAEALAPEGILVLPISSDRGGAAVVGDFYKSHAITALPIWLDPRGDAARAWGARGLPTTLIVDRAGNERARLEGGADWSTPEMLAAVRKLVAA